MVLSSVMQKCIICDSGFKPAFNKYGYQITVCPNCLLFQTNLDEPYAEVVNEYYSRSYFMGSKNRTGYADYEGDQEVDGKNFNRFIKVIKKYKQTGKLLDIGCATGGFLSFAQSAGFSVSGTDVSDFAVKKAKKKFPNKIRKGAFSKLNYPAKSFDVVSMFDVIEHLENPKIALGKIHQTLKSDGLLVFTTGNSSSLTARLLGKRWFFFVPPQHIWVFNRNNLGQLLSNTGFDMVKFNYVGRHLSMKHLVHQARTVYPNPITKLLYTLFSGAFFKSLSMYINFYSTVIVVAQKKK